MLFQLQVYPQFRDADHDGLIGLRGCMRYFQDCHTHFMCSIEKGNDVIPERYGAAWIYTQYHVSINRKLGYDAPLLLRQWIQPYRRALLLTLNTTFSNNNIMEVLFSVNQKQVHRIDTEKRRHPVALHQKSFHMGHPPLF